MVLLSLTLMCKLKDASAAYHGDNLDVTLARPWLRCQQPVLLFYILCHIFFVTHISVCLLQISEECGDCGHIWYSNQVSCVAHNCKIAFGSIPYM